MRRKTRVRIQEGNCRCELEAAENLGSSAREGHNFSRAVSANALKNICLERASLHEAGGGNGRSAVFRYEVTTDTVMLGRGKQLGTGNMDFSKPDPTAHLVRGPGFDGTTVAP